MYTFKNVSGQKEKHVKTCQIIVIENNTSCQSLGTFSPCCSEKVVNVGSTAAEKYYTVMKTSLKLLFLRSNALIAMYMQTYTCKHL